MKSVYCIDVFEDSEALYLKNKIDELFPAWKVKAVHGEDPDYASEIGYDLAKVRAKVQSYDRMLKVLETRRKELHERLQENCEHNYVAEQPGDPKSSYSHEQYDVRVCEVCGLQENGKGATYNHYNHLSDKNLGRVMIRRVDSTERRKIEKLRGIQI